MQTLAGYASVTVQNCTWFQLCEQRRWPPSWRASRPTHRI